MAHDPLRRCDVMRMTAEEKLILEAVVAIEALGADTRLSSAVSALDRAREHLANFVDGVPGKA